MLSGDATSDASVFLHALIISSFGFAPAIVNSQMSETFGITSFNTHSTPVALGPNHSDPVIRQLSFCPFSTDFFLRRFELFTPTGHTTIFFSSTL